MNKNEIKKYLENRMRIYTKSIIQSEGNPIHLATLGMLAQIINEYDANYKNCSYERLTGKSIEEILLTVELKWTNAIDVEDISMFVQEYTESNGFPPSITEYIERKIYWMLVDTIDD